MTTHKQTHTFTLMCTHAGTLQSETEGMSPKEEQAQRTDIHKHTHTHHTDIQSKIKSTDIQPVCCVGLPWDNLAVAWFSQ